MEKETQDLLDIKNKEINDTYDQWKKNMSEKSKPHIAYFDCLKSFNSWNQKNKMQHCMQQSGISAEAIGLESEDKNNLTTSTSNAQPTQKPIQNPIRTKLELAKEFTDAQDLIFKNINEIAFSHVKYDKLILPCPRTIQQTVFVGDFTVKPHQKSIRSFIFGTNMCKISYDDY